MNTRGRTVVGLLVGKGWAKSQAVAHVKALSDSGLISAYDHLTLEARGQQRLPMATPDPNPAPRAKKVSYSLLLPPEMLEAVKAAADRDGSSASQFIRTAIAKQLGRVK